MFDVENISEVKNIKPSNEYMLRIEKLLSDSERDENGREGINTDFKGLNKKSQKVLFDIITLLKERLSEDSSEETSYNTFRYLQTYLVADNYSSLLKNTNKSQLGTLKKMKETCYF